MTSTPTNAVPSCFKCNTPYQTVYDSATGPRFVPQCWCNDVTSPSKVPTIPIPPTPTKELSDLIDAVKELTKQVSDLVDEIKEKNAPHKDRKVLND